jgi:hypothetical protein
MKAPLRITLLFLLIMMGKTPIYSCDEFESDKVDGALVFSMWESLSQKNKETVKLKLAIRLESPYDLICEGCAPHRVDLVLKVLGAILSCEEWGYESWFELLDSEQAFFKNSLFKVLSEIMPKKPCAFEKSSILKVPDDWFSPIIIKPVNWRVNSHGMYIIYNGRDLEPGYNMYIQDSFSELSDSELDLLLFKAPSIRRNKKC